MLPYNVSLQSLFQKSELENKLTMAASPLKDSTGKSSAILVKQLQEELRNFVSSIGYFAYLLQTCSLVTD